jgi:hypothetical protein
MKSKSRLAWAVLASASLIVAACGGDDGADAPATEAPAASEAPTDSEAPAATEAAKGWTSRLHRQALWLLSGSLDATVYSSVRRLDATST